MKTILSNVRMLVFKGDSPQLNIKIVQNIFVYYQKKKKKAKKNKLFQITRCVFFLLDSLTFKADNYLISYLF